MFDQQTFNVCRTKTDLLTWLDKHALDYVYEEYMVFEYWGTKFLVRMGVHYSSFTGDRHFIFNSVRKDSEKEFVDYVVAHGYVVDDTEDEE